MAVFKTAGTKIYIGPTIADTGADFIASDFSGLSYVEIKNTTNLGDFGDTAAAITSDEIGRARTRKAKGTRNAGTMTLVCNDNPTDPGQLALYAAEQDNVNNYAFMIVLSDGPSSGGSGSVRYFAAKVTSTPEGLGGANQFATATFSLDIDSNIVRVAATSGVSIPVNSVVPTITGTAAHGNVLTASTGTWTNSPTSYTYQWNSNGTPIANEDAHDASYTVEAGDVGNTLTVTVTANNAGGASLPATSAATATVT